MSFGACKIESFPSGSHGKESACNVEDPSSIPGLGRSPGGGNGNPLQYSVLGNPMDRGALWATVHGILKSQTGLKRLSSSSSRGREGLPWWLPMQEMGKVLSLGQEDPLEKEMAIHSSILA